MFTRTQPTFLEKSRQKTFELGESLKRDWFFCLGIAGNDLVFLVLCGGRTNDFFLYGQEPWAIRYAGGVIPPANFKITTFLKPLTPGEVARFTATERVIKSDRYETHTLVFCRKKHNYTCYIII